MEMGANVGSSARQHRSSQLAYSRHTYTWVRAVKKKVSITKSGARDVLR